MSSGVRINRPGSGTRSPGDGPAGPVQPPQRRAKASIWSQLLGERITIQCRAGLIITGKVTDVRDGCIRLSHVEIRGQEYVVRPEWVMVDRSQVAHVHPADTALERAATLGGPPAETP